MKRILLTEKNLEEIKSWTKGVSFVLNWGGSYWTKTGLSPYKENAQIFKSSFFKSQFCKDVIKDENMHIELLK
tara:strand:+ start:182 stop:400 length:219 start_codon:yes stop_codon:yes gene_type:complete